MQTYTIRRRKAWSSPEELQAAAKRSKEVADSDSQRGPLDPELCDRRRRRDAGHRLYLPGG